MAQTSPFLYWRQLSRCQRSQNMFMMMMMWVLEQDCDQQHDHMCAPLHQPTLFIIIKYFPGLAQLSSAGECRNQFITILMIQTCWFISINYQPISHVHVCLLQYCTVHLSLLLQLSLSHDTSSSTAPHWPLTSVNMSDEWSWFTVFIVYCWLVRRETRPEWRLSSTLVRLESTLLMKVIKILTKT